MNNEIERAREWLHERITKSGNDLITTEHQVVRWLAAYHAHCTAERPQGSAAEGVLPSQGGLPDTAQGCVLPLAAEQSTAEAPVPKCISDSDLCRCGHVRGMHASTTNEATNNDCSCASCRCEVFQGERRNHERRQGDMQTCSCFDRVDISSTSDSYGSEYKELNPNCRRHGYLSSGRDRRTADRRKA